jgi:hypothetical protein
MPAHVLALSVAHPDWHGAYDQNATAAEAARRRLLDRVIADKIMICVVDSPWPGFGNIVWDGARDALTVHTDVTAEEHDYNDPATSEMQFMRGG